MIAGICYTFDSLDFKLVCFEVLRQNRWFVAYFIHVRSVFSSIQRNTVLVCCLGDVTSRIAIFCLRSSYLNKSIGKSASLRVQRTECLSQKFNETLYRAMSPCLCSPFRNKALVQFVILSVNQIHSYCQWFPFIRAFFGLGFQTTLIVRQLNFYCLRFSLSCQIIKANTLLFLLIQKIF